MELTTKIAAGADLTIAGANRKFLVNRTIQNEGLLIEGTTNVEIVELDGTAVLNNAGVPSTSRNDRIWEKFSAPAGTLTISEHQHAEEDRWHRKAFTLDNTRFNNSGAVEIQTGTLTFDGTGLADGVSSGSYAISSTCHASIHWRQPAFRSGDIGDRSGTDRSPVADCSTSMPAHMRSISQSTSLMRPCWARCSVDIDLSAAQVNIANGGTLIGSRVR